jgi:hypothetical protein
LEIWLFKYEADDNFLDRSARAHKDHLIKDSLDSAWRKFSERSAAEKDVR